MIFKRLVIIILFFAGSLHAQSDCDQIRTLLEKGDTDGALTAARKMNGISGPQCNIIAGEVYLQRGRNDLAASYFEKAMQEATDNSEEKATALNNLGIVFWNTGNSHQAKEYVIQALSIRKKLYGDSHERIAASYNDLGLVAQDDDQALEYYETALGIYEKLYQDGKHRKIAQAKSNIGIVYRQIELYGDALNNFNEALEIWRSLYPEGHPNEGFILTNIGRTYQVMGDLDAAHHNFDKALAVYKKHYGQKHPEIANTYNLIGNVHNFKGQFEEAVTHYQHALVANSPEFNNENIEMNPPADGYLNARIMLNSLYYKAQALEDFHINFSLKFRDLKLSLSTLQSADTLTDRLRQLSSNEADKLSLGEIASQVYENGVRLCYYMADVSVKKDPYYELAFYFAEKSKAAVLLQAISDASAKSFANIPDEKLKEEHDLQAEIAFYEQKLAQKPDEETERLFRQQLFQLRQKYADFITALEAQYPEYFNLKYNTSTPGVAEIQQSLSEGSVMFSYFLADRTRRVYVFQISKDKFKADNVPQTENFNRYISGMRNSIYFRDDDVYHLCASELYKTLFPSSPHKNTSQLIIVPSGRLGTIPFEALLTRSPRSGTDYGSLDYLMNDYAISYQYAAALYVQKANNPMPALQQNQALLCAPVTFPHLADLPATSDEVNKLSSIFSGKSITPDVLLEADASEELLRKKDLSNYRYLHFATHGIVNESHPALSGIFLKESTAHDGNLYSGEIYNLRLNASLVTLSACETGLGKISRGEGIIGLSRALIYAGANNIVVSLWNVADNSTADLMTSFYNRLSEGNFTGALQQAKADMIRSGNYSHPYYWAPFVLIGQ